MLNTFYALWLGLGELNQLIQFIQLIHYQPGKPGDTGKYLSSDTFGKLEYLIFSATGEQEIPHSGNRLCGYCIISGFAIPDGYLHFQHEIHMKPFSSSMVRP